MYARENQKQSMFCSPRSVDDCNSRKTNKRGSLQSICHALGIAASRSREFPRYAVRGGVVEDNVAVQDFHDADPIYKLFIDHLREDGNSYILEMMDRELGSVLVKYEEIPETDPQTQEISDYAAHGNARMNGATCVGGSSSSTKFVQNAPFVSGSQLKMESPIDDNYQKFLNCVRLQDGHMVLEWGPGVSVRYEENQTSSPFAGSSTRDTLSSSGREMVAYQSTQHYISQSGVEDDDAECIVPHASTDTFHYKEKLLEVLSKPYDHNEYVELLGEATERKPLTKLKHLRGMSISYATKEKGLSYLDHHPDLAVQMGGADCQTALTLLRGFFFWLKNLSHEGAFMPWRSPPESDEKLPTNDSEIVLPMERAAEEA